MVDRGKARDAKEAACFAETLADQYRLVYGQAVESAGRHQRAREFSELVSSNLGKQTEAGRAGADKGLPQKFAHRY